MNYNGYTLRDITNDDEELDNRPVGEGIDSRRLNTNNINKYFSLSYIPHSNPNNIRFDDTIDYYSKIIDYVKYIGVKTINGELMHVFENTRDQPYKYFGLSKAYIDDLNQEGLNTLYSIYDVEIVAPSTPLRRRNAKVSLKFSLKRLNMDLKKVV
jgi:hypothetical protein